MSKENHKKPGNHQIDRRKFFRNGALTISTGLFLPKILNLSDLTAMGSSETNTQRVVFIFLRGGADALSILSPREKCPGFIIDGKHVYNEVMRPTQHLNQNQLLAVGDDRFGLHPIAGGLHRLSRENKLTFIMGAGSPNETTSHFLQQDWIENGQGETRNNNITGGFLNRALAGISNYGPLPAFSLSSRLAKSLHGPSPALAFPDVSSINLNSKSFTIKAGMGLRQRIKTALLNNSSPNPIYNIVARRARELDVAADVFDDVSKNRDNEDNTLKVSASEDYSGFSKFRKIVELLHQEPSVRFVTVDADTWDDHADIGAQDGNFSRRLANLSTALDTFVGDLEANDLFKDTTIVVLSEFGRRVSENSASGFDHGRGGIAMVLGENMPNRVIASPNFGVTPSRLENGNLPVDFDYRKIFAEVLERKLALPNVYKAIQRRADDEIPAVFPGLNRSKYGIIS